MPVETFQLTNEEKEEMANYLEEDWKNTKLVFITIAVSIVISLGLFNIQEFLSRHKSHLTTCEYQLDRAIDRSTQQERERIRRIGKTGKKNKFALK